MTDEKPVLQRSVETRVPVFTGDESTSKRAEMLADHILATSLIRGELAELRLHAYIELKTAQKAWDELQGWEVHRGRDKTKAGERAAKTQANPKLAETLTSAEWTIARCSEEMERLDKDATRCNQSYTIVTGG